jgi:hypothetical protein
MRTCRLQRQPELLRVLGKYLTSSKEVLFQNLQASVPIKTLTYEPNVATITITITIIHGLRGFSLGTSSAGSLIII